ncbi:MAG TPA: anthranilate phosphoribosyltransferase [Polyangiaceae bacterium]
MKFADAYAELVKSQSISVATARAAFDAILRGEWTPVQTGAFVVALRTAKAETEEIIAAGAEAMRSAMTPVAHSEDVVVDTCGTGGDGAGTLNLSTAAAIVVAACGVTVAKHGNRSVSSRCGSADVVEALGIPLDLTPERQSELLAEVKIAFLFAPAHHPALKHAATARRELGVRTIFNALVPLANPARASHQLVGVYDDALRPVMARALGKLGVKRAWVVRAEDGLDEVSLHAPTRVSELHEDGHVVDHMIHSSEFGLAAKPEHSLAGSSSEENAKAIETIFGERGGGHPAIDAVVLNSAAALVVAGVESDKRTAAERARAAIARGDARALLARWKKAAGART